MKRTMQKAVAFIMSLLMVLTMSNWSGIAATVAQAAETIPIYFYNGDGWFRLDTWLDATDGAYEDGIYAVFKDGYDSSNKTAAYQLLNNYRTYVTSQMTMFKSKEGAVNSLKK